MKILGGGQPMEPPPPTIFQIRPKNGSFSGQSSQKALSLLRTILSFLFYKNDGFHNHPAYSYNKCDKLVTYAIGTSITVTPGMYRVVPVLSACLERERERKEERKGEGGREKRKK